MEFRLPDLGEGIVQAELVQWMVAPGDRVVRGQNIAEVMTDKAAVELPSPFEGTINRLLVQAGAYVDVGSVMATFEPAGSSRPTTWSCSMRTAMATRTSWPSTNRA